jgi:integrase
MSLHGDRGGRKYLNAAERRRFAVAAATMPRDVELFCLTLAWSGARISEALNVTAAAFDLDRGVVALVTLKRRRRTIREVVLPPDLLDALVEHYSLRDVHDLDARDKPLWPWCRQSGWRYIKSVMAQAGIAGDCAMPKGLRHGFAVAAFQACVPPHIVQKWMGHASLRTTAIYADVSGPEEHGFAERMWWREPRMPTIGRPPVTYSLGNGALSPLGATWTLTYTLGPGREVWPG